MTRASHDDAKNTREVVFILNKNFRRALAIALCACITLGSLGVLTGCEAQSISITSPEDLTIPGARVGVFAASSSALQLEAIASDAQILYYNSIADALLAVQQDKADAYVYDYGILKYQIASGAASGVVLLEETFGEPYDVVVGISKVTKVENLQQHLNEFLAQLHADGTLDDMYERWVLQAQGIMPDIPEPENPTMTIRIGTTGLSEPFTYYADGEVTGFDVELARRFALYMNAELKIVMYDYYSIVAAAATGQMDCIMANLNATEERAESLDFSNSVYESISGILVADASDPADDGQVTIEDLNKPGITFGVVIGTTSEVFLAQNCPQANISTFQSVADTFLALSSGKVDYVISAYTHMLNARRSYPNIQVCIDNVIEEAASIAVSKDSPELLARIDEIVAEFKADGTLENIISNWTGDVNNYVIDDIPVSDGANGVLRVAISADREPMCFMMDGEYRGLDCELIERIAYEMGMTVEYQNTSFSSLVAALTSGRADVVISNIAATQERRESVDFTQPYFDNPQVIVKMGSGSSTEGEFTGLDELNGRTVSVVLGSLFDTFVREAIPEANVEYYNSYSDQIIALKTGKVDAVALDLPIAELITAQEPTLTMIDEKLADDAYGFAFTKGNGLVDEANAIIAQLRQDGTLDDMKAKWCGADESVKVLPDIELTGENGTLRVACTAEGGQPMCYIGESGELLGYDIEMVYRVAQALGMDVEFEDSNFTGALASVESGKSDLAVACLSITEERKETFDMSDPYFDGGIYVLVRRANADDVEEIGFFEGLAASFERTFITEGRWKLILEGLLVTIIITLASAILGTVLGFLICQMRRSRSRAASGTSVAIIRIIQGTPIVVILMILYYVVFGSLDISAIMVGILGFSINFAVYVAEMMRTGIAAVDKGQVEAALALGFTKNQAFWKITFPQAAIHFLPVYKGEFVSMLKMTSVVGYIAITDLTKASDLIRSRTLEAFFPLIATALIYFLVSALLSALLTRVEIGVAPKRGRRSIKGVRMREEESADAAKDSSKGATA